MSWSDRIAEATKGIERAKVMLDQATQKVSKGRIELLIEDAIRESGAKTTVDDLLELYDLAYSSRGLQGCAEHFAKDLADPNVRREYFLID